MKVQFNPAKTNSRPAFKSVCASCRIPDTVTAQKITEVYKIASNRTNMNLRLESEWKTLLTFLNLLKEKMKKDNALNNVLSEINPLIPENLAQHKLINLKMQNTVTEFPHGGPKSTDIHLLVEKPEGQLKYSHITSIDDGSPVNKLLIAIQDAIIPANVDVNHFQILMARHVDTFDAGQQAGLDYVERFLLPNEAGGDKDVQKWVDFRSCWSKVINFLQEKEKQLK